jgi:hypothetical protein
MRHFFIIIIILFFYSCYHYSQKEKELQHTLQSTIHLDNISNLVYTENDSMTFDLIRQQYKYISLVYLQDGCEPCYPNFIRWHTEMQKLDCPENHTLLFIIKGNSYYNFMANIYDIQPVENRCLVVMDKQGTYLENNQHIPQWVMLRSVLIDAENRVRLVGEPFATPDMTRLFYSIVNGDDKN